MHIHKNKTTMAINPSFKMGNMINLSKEELSKPIYRIIPMDFLELMLNNKTLALAKTSSWEDIYENFFYKEKFQYNGSQVTLEHLGLIIFGQSWSFFKDSDAMWRIYSGEKKSVRIKTTVEKLFDAIYIEDNCMASTYIGAVEYKSKKELIEWINQNNPVSFQTINKTLVNSLFLKRNNFSHEKEVRVIYQPDSHSHDSSSSLKIYDITPNDFLDEITFDPRAEDSYITESMKIISKYGFPLSRVNKSPLYDFQPVNIQIV